MKVIYSNVMKSSTNKKLITIVRQQEDLKTVGRIMEFCLGGTGDEQTFVLVCCPKDKKIPPKTRTNFLLKIIPTALRLMPRRSRSLSFNIPVACSRYEKLIVRRSESTTFFTYLDQVLAGEANNENSPYGHLLYRFYR